MANLEGRGRGRNVEFWSNDESEDDETSSLNPQRVLSFSIEEEHDIRDAECGMAACKGLRRKKGKKAKVSSSSSMSRIAPDAWSHLVAPVKQLDKLTVAVICIVLIGTALIIPGLLMRMEFVPTPYPFVALPLKKCGVSKAGAGSWFTLTGMNCPAGISVTGQDSLVKGTNVKAGSSSGQVSVELHPNFLMQSIHYMPRIAFPEHLQLTGEVSFELQRDGETVADATLSLSEFKASQMYRLGIKGTEVPVYLPKVGSSTSSSSSPSRSSSSSSSLASSPSLVGGGKMCSAPVGCTYKLASTMVEGAAVRSGFVISPGGIELNTNTDLAIAMRPISKLTLVFKNTKIRAVSESKSDPFRVPPEILLSFHQYLLTERQARGITVAFAGVSVLFVGLSLLCLSRAMKRDKTKEP
mmetsp:Transcript_18981/g.33946  ORF Transcript_18981/g.33946 Transcript_18981/m.33946 type:complete len:411 (-) Transcript_18981:393-1625(-)|eukprot:CAMPEP_0197529194 /NCGR_PEP_ID=MMETSP1318-20131121/27584_1 /TAXON_ID=552666 /ORGANISM="Partenskyella glossopodia, Strain RCC365" /LENGTH=410 /DNA_ID=CAMNT_0043084573 /DNA_START=135 /DNA_END=1367 /DNA_ORIENTATION=-